MGASGRFWTPLDNVELNDYSLLTNTWLLESTDTGWEVEYDLDDSGVIDFADLMIFAEKWLFGTVVGGD